MRVAGDGMAGLAQDGKQDSFGSSALMGGNDVAESGEGADGVLEPVPALAAGVGFVATHHGRPLFGGHGAGAGVGEEIDQDIAGVNEEQVVAGLLEETIALAGRSLAERFNTLDAEWFDDGFHYASTSILASAA